MKEPLVETENRSDQHTQSLHLQHHLEEKASEVAQGSVAKWVSREIWRFERECGLVARKTEKRVSYLKTSTSVI